MAVEAPGRRHQWPVGRGGACDSDIEWYRTSHGVQIIAVYTTLLVEPGVQVQLGKLPGWLPRQCRRLPAAGGWCRNATIMPA